jgi:hypothetical protein
MATFAYTATPHPVTGRISTTSEDASGECGGTRVAEGGAGSGE